MLIPLIQAYLSREASLDEIQDLIIDITWADEDDVDPAALRLAKRLQLLIAEYAGGNLSGQEFRSELRRTTGINEVVVSVVSPSSQRRIPRFWSGSAARTRTVEFA